MSTQDNIDESVGNGSTVQKVVVLDKSGLYIAIIALIMACLCFGYLLIMPSLIEAKVQAGVAQSNATAHNAEVHARVALDKVEDFRAKLAAKGIDVPPLDGH